jgi:dTDP-4-dehydrorhamnose reductase
VELDLDRPDSVRQAVAAWRPDVVLHAAAMASMGACEADPAAAWRRNAEATSALAGSGARTVFVSTDLVFDGRSAPYAADREPGPVSAYGRSKVGGEAAVRAAGGLVVRVPLLFGPSFDGRRGATDMLRVARAEGRTLSLFTDEFRTPIHASDAARRLADLALAPAVRGTVHVAGPERLSRYEFAERFATVQGWGERPWRAARSEDPTRPPDVSLEASEPAARSLDAMLRDA